MIPVLVLISLLPMALAFPEIVYGQNFTNSTNGDLSETSISVTTLLSLIVTVAAASGIPTTALTIYYQRRHQRLSSIKEAFGILNNDEHRKARQIVYDAFKEYESGKRDVFKSESIIPSAAMVRADLDQIGLLISNGLIPEDLFLQAYWNTVLVCWKALEKDIEYYRKKRDYPTYMQYFEQLKQNAESFWKEHRPETKEIKVY